MERKKRKSKKNRRKLVIKKAGRFQIMSSQGISGDDLDDHMTTNIGEMIGFSFISNQVNKDPWEDNKKEWIRDLKESLWSSIDSLLSSYNITWIIFGDVNVVRSHEERSGCGFNIGEMNRFNDFIARNGLFDFLLGGM
ncbi:cysteine-rich receptor-like protein kinase, partial [Tanacetum coccineum]